MNVIVLTGIGGGLGKALHDLLISERFSNHQKIFISHSHVAEKDPEKKTQYINVDFSADLNGALRFEGIGISATRLIFLNNAGVVSPIGSANGIEPRLFRASLNVNLHAPMEIASALTSAAKVAGSKLLIFNVTSGAANRPIKGWMPYCVGKAAVKMAFDVMAAEEPDVNVVHFDPGVMDTGMQSIIRDSSDVDMPDVLMFRALKDTNSLKTPEIVAEEILELLQINEP